MPRPRKRSRYPFITDLSIPIDYDLFRVGLTQSYIGRFFKCPIEFLIGLNRYKQKDSEQKMGWGSLFHHLLDRLYREFKESKELIYDKSDILREIDLFYKERPEYLVEKSEEDTTLRETQSIILLQEYINFYKVQGEFKNFRVLYIEEEFKVLHKYALLRGKFDGLVKDTLGNFWLLEHKTILRIMEEFLRLVLAFDFQSLFYIYCIELMYSYLVKGVQYNIVRNSSMKRTLVKGTKRKESWYSFRTRFRAHIKKDPKHYFKRFAHPYTPRNKVDFEEELNVILLEITNFINDPVTYHRRSSCQGMYTCWNINACNNNRLLGYKQSNKYFSELEDR